MGKKKSKASKAATSSSTGTATNGQQSEPASATPSRAQSVADGDEDQDDAPSLPTTPEPASTATSVKADDDQPTEAPQAELDGPVDDPEVVVKEEAAPSEPTPPQQSVDISSPPPAVAPALAPIPQVPDEKAASLPSEPVAAAVVDSEAPSSAAASIGAPAPPPSHAAQESVASTLDSLPAIDASLLSSSPRPSLDVARPSVLDLRDEGEGEQIILLKKALDKTKSEKEKVEAQYKNLVGKVGNMRETLGKKLQEDAEELDRREALITALTADTQTLKATMATLQQELTSQAAESSSLSTALSALRLQSSSTSDSALLREREVRELQGEVERLRMEREEWEEVAGNERARAEEEDMRVRELEGEVRRLIAEGGKERERRKKEEERAANLQYVLETSEASKESDLRSAVTDLETQLRNTTASLSEWKLRASTAEARFTEFKSDAGKTQSLEREVKEKNLIIGKIRHENVIMNEHLTEALRRIKKNSGDENVDRRLVTNILLSYLTTARGDSKRFEMLSLLSSILSWSDLEREQAGLQKSSAKAGSMLRRPSGIVARPIPEDEEEPANESFSQLFVEFLMKEATSGAPSASASSAGSPPASQVNLLSPARSSFSVLSPSSAQTTPTGSPRTFNRTLSLGSPAPSTTPLSTAGTPPAESDTSSRPRLGSMASFGLRAVGFGGSSKTPPPPPPPPVSASEDE